MDSIEDYLMNQLKRLDKYSIFPQSEIPSIKPIEELNPLSSQKNYKQALNTNVNVPLNNTNICLLYTSDAADE